MVVTIVLIFIVFDFSLELQNFKKPLKSYRLKTLKLGSTTSEYCENTGKVDFVATRPKTHRSHLHFQSFSGFRYGRRIFLQAIVPGSQNAIPEIRVHVQFLEVHAELLAVRLVQVLSERQQPIVREIPAAHGEVLEDAEPVRNFLLDPHHTEIQIIYIRIVPGNSTRSVCCLFLFRVLLSPPIRIVGCVNETARECNG